MKALTQRQRSFAAVMAADEYQSHEKAALEAGYSQSAACGQAAINLRNPRIKTLIAELKSNKGQNGSDKAEIERLKKEILELDKQLKESRVKALNPEQDQESRRAARESWITTIHHVFSLGLAIPLDDARAADAALATLADDIETWLVAGQSGAAVD